MEAKIVMVNEEPHVQIGSFEGYLDPEDRTVNFTVNLCPDQFEDELTHNEFIKAIGEQLALYTELLNLATFLNGCYIEGDFYPGEADLNLRIQVSYDHSKVGHLNLDQYE